MLIDLALTSEENIDYNIIEFRFMRENTSEFEVSGEL